MSISEERKNELRENILNNYDIFLEEQREIAKSISGEINGLLSTYRADYIGYYMNNLDETYQKAYQVSLERIEEIRKSLREMTELLDFFGLLDEEQMRTELKTIKDLRIKNHKLKTLERHVKNSNNASVPQNQEFTIHNRNATLYIILKVFLLITILGVLYIQYKNKQ